jgi:hypothetical protein
MNKETIRLLLANQEEIMRALAVLALQNGNDTGANLLNEAANKTSVHCSSFYPLHAAVLRTPIDRTPAGVE